MTALQTIACMIAYAPLEPEIVDASASSIIDYQLTDRIPFWDDWVASNSVSTRVYGNIGRLRAEAWGVSNPFTNFRSLAGATFQFWFWIQPDQMVFRGGFYRLSVDFRENGQFLHTPAVPRMSDNRQPPARTFSHMSSRVSAFIFGEQDRLIALGMFSSTTDHTRMQEAADGGLCEIIDGTTTVSHEMNLPGDRPIAFRVERTIIAAATGCFSNCSVRGSEGRFRFRVIAENPRIQKVLQPSDPCFNVLNP